MSLFSDLNNLVDITLDPRFATICGYTERNVDTVFAPELPGLDRDAIREWCNGYGWLGEETVYNRSMCCCCSARAVSPRTDSKRARPPSW